MDYEKRSHHHGQFHMRKLKLQDVFSLLLGKQFSEFAGGRMETEPVIERSNQK